MSIVRTGPPARFKGSSQSLVPGILNQLGPDSLHHCAKLARHPTSISFHPPQAALVNIIPPNATGARLTDDDDESPYLVENFEFVEADQREATLKNTQLMEKKIVVLGLLV